MKFVRRTKRASSVSLPQVAALLLLSALLLTGCSDFVDQDQARVGREIKVILKADHPVGQTFVARHGGLNGVDFWLSPREAPEGQIRLHLRAEPGAQADLATATLPAEQVDHADFYRFSFEPLPDSHSRYFYAFLELEGTGKIRVGAGPGDAYLDGALYRDHEPRDVQAAFRLAYAPGWMLLDLGQALLRWAGLLVVSMLLYLVPGWALLAWLWPEERPLSWAGRLGIAAGLSLALYPLLFLWTDLVGLHLGPLYAWLPVVGGLAALAWRYRDWRPRRGLEALRRWRRSERLWPDLALVVIVGLVFAVRLLVVRSLDAPMWGDSYQHTMITQLLVDHGGLFDSWAPYAELQTFTYHFGFHTAMAGFHWLTGLEMHQAVLWGAQVLNGLAVLALYPLALHVSGKRWAGVGAVLVAGLLSPMPMYYVNWGRYTQLAGQAILPGALVLSWLALEASRRDRRLAVLSWIAVGGLALTHFRVLIFYTVLILAWVLLNLNRKSWRRNLSRVAWLEVGAALLFLPWFIHIFTGELMLIVEEKFVVSSAELSSSVRSYSRVRNITFYFAPVGWLLLVVSAAAGLWRRQRGVLLFSLGWFLLLLVTNPDWLHLPGSGLINNLTLFMAAYIPAGVLIGDLLGWSVARFRPRWWAPLVASLTVVAGLLGATARLGDPDLHKHALITRPDLRAMAWIQENMPADAKFLINAFPAYGGSVIVGSDGGWWLPLLAGRANSVPPLNYGMERNPWPGYREGIQDLNRYLRQEGIDSPAMLEALDDQGASHVYLGQRQGRVNYEGPNVLAPAAFQESEHYRLVYHQDRVWVFEYQRAR